MERLHATHRGSSLRALLDRCSLAGIAFGVALVMQPWWSAGLRAGFFVVLAATLAQVVAAHSGRGERA